MMLSLLFAIAAPVPAPRPLMPEMMVGTWDYSWGSQLDGWITFLDDGRYFSRHTTGTFPEYTGKWTLWRDTLTLHEGRFTEGEAPVCSTRYPVVISSNKYPTLTGKWEPQGTPVVLIRRKE